MQTIEGEEKDIVNNEVLIQPVAEEEEVPIEAIESIGKENTSVPGLSEAPVPLSVDASVIKTDNQSRKVVPMNNPQANQIVNIVGSKLEQQVRRKTKYKSRREIEYSDDDSQEEEGT